MGHLHGKGPGRHVALNGGWLLGLGGRNIEAGVMTGQQPPEKDVVGLITGAH